MGNATVASLKSALNRERSSEPAAEEYPPPSMESLAAMRGEVHRERLLDMEGRLKRYRLITFGILGLSLLALGPRLGWWWLAPLVVALAGFVVADHYLERSARPHLWIGVAWALSPALIFGGVVFTGGPDSPVVMWLAIPAVTLGARFEPRGIVIGTSYIFALMLIGTVAIDPAGAVENYPAIVAAASLLISIVVLSSALAESDRAFRKRSTLDPLTGSFNRNALDQRLAELEGHPISNEEGVSFGFLLCDLDHFKQVNDVHGHVVGDAVLQDAAYVIRNTLRASDAIYRVGGEEFLIVLPAVGEDAATVIAQRLCDAVRDRRPGGIDVTISIGVAGSVDGGLDTDEMVARADGALYAAKAGGRDRVCVSGSPVPATAG
jgi:diguanylate cyclase (GGDEF)-like protein